MVSWRQFMEIRERWSNRWIAYSQEYIYRWNCWVILVIHFCFFSLPSTDFFKPSFPYNTARFRLRFAPNISIQLADVYTNWSVFVLITIVSGLAVIPSIHYPVHVQLLELHIYQNSEQKQRDGSYFTNVSFWASLRRKILCRPHVGNPMGSTCR